MRLLFRLLQIMNSPSTLRSQERALWGKFAAIVGSKASASKSYAKMKQLAKAIRLIRAKKYFLMLDMLEWNMNLVLLGNALKWFRPPELAVGIAGMVASFIGLYRLWLAVNAKQRYVPLDTPFSMPTLTSPLPTVRTSEAIASSAAPAAVEITKTSSAPPSSQVLRTNPPNIITSSAPESNIASTKKSVPMNSLGVREVAQVPLVSEAKTPVASPSRRARPSNLRPNDTNAARPDRSFDLQLDESLSPLTPESPTSDLRKKNWRRDTLSLLRHVEQHESQMEVMNTNFAVIDSSGEET